jgi:hypothetical protein
LADRGLDFVDELKRLVFAKRLPRTMQQGPDPTFVSPDAK